MRSLSKGKMYLTHQVALTALICAVAAAASAQSTPTDKPPETAPASGPGLAVALVGPAREIKLSENTWFRFGAQVQAWAKFG